MKLVSLERWDRMIIANVKFFEPIKHLEKGIAFSTMIHLELADNLGTKYIRFGGHGGGGRADWEREYSEVSYRFAPVPAESTELTFTATVRFRELHLIEGGPGQGWRGFGHSADDREWNDPEPWVFHAKMPRHEDKLTLLDDEPLEPSPVIVRHARGGIPIGLEPEASLPVLQQRRVGTDLFTLIALDFFADSIEIDWMVEEEQELFHDPMFRCSMRDDCGNAYAMWPGGGGGQPTPGGSRWRYQPRASPALDPAAKTLFLALEGARPNPENRTKQFGQLDMENDAEQWLFAVPVELGNTAAQPNGT
ncbi:MAG: hypothetical protein ACRDHN_13205 [Thermomicrobiales bacterium]